MTTEEKRAIRREWINYFLQNPSKKYNGDIKDSVRMMELIKFGCTLPVYYKNWSAIWE